MKKITFTLFGILTIILSGFSQPTLTPNSNKYYDRFEFQFVEYTSAGIGGTNVTWDFSSSSLISNGTMTQEWLPVAATPYGNSFPQANLALQMGNNYDYYYSGQDFLGRAGAHLGGVNLAYYKPQKFMVYPFTYNDQFIDTFSSKFVANGFTFYRKGTMTAVADGYGTLILPSITHQNVLRVSYEEIMTDSTTVMGSPYILEYETYVHNWFIEGQTLPVFSVVEQYSAQGYSSYSYYNSEVILNTPSLTIHGNLSLYPNPVNELLQVNMSGFSHNSVVQIFNIGGQQIFEDRKGSSDQMVITTSEWHSGLYIVKVTDGNQVFSEKFLKQ